MGPVLTLYAPVSGRVEEAAAGAAVVHEGAGVVAAPTRGTVSRLEACGLVLTDLRGRSVGVQISSDAGEVVPLVADGDQAGFDRPLFRLDAPGADATFIVTVVSLGIPDVLLHAEPGAEVAAGADLVSVGPFACGA